MKFRKYALIKYSFLIVFFYVSSCFGSFDLDKRESLFPNDYRWDRSD